MKNGKIAVSQTDVLKLDWARIVPDFLNHLDNFHHDLNSVDRRELCFLVIEKVLSGVRPWNSARHPDILQHLAWCAESEASNARKSARVSKSIDHIIVLDGVETNLMDSVESGAPNPEQMVLVKEEIAIIERAIADDQRAQDVFVAYPLGCRAPREVAEYIGVDVKEVYSTLKRIGRRVAVFRSKLEK